MKRKKDYSIEELNELNLNELKDIFEEFWIDDEKIVIESAFNIFMKKALEKEISVAASQQIHNKKEELRLMFHAMESYKKCTEKKKREACNNYKKNQGSVLFAMDMCL